MRAIDVLLVSQPVDYGVAIHVRQLVEAGLAAGHRVTVASPGAERGPLAGWIREAGGRHHALDMARQPSPRDAIDVVTLRRLAAGKDVMHLHSSKAAALGRVAAMTFPRRARPAVVVTPHYWSWLVGGPLAPLYRRVERVLASRCDAIIALSEVEASEGRAVLGPSAPLRVIANGVDLDRFSPDGDRADRIADAPLLVCVGRLSHQKGQDVAIRALAELGDRTARLRFVGDESAKGEHARLRSLAASLGVDGRVEWRGAVDDTATEYRAADVVVVPSRWDGMSLALLEAMASGAAIVATEVSGTEALGGTGVVVPPEDPSALARAIDDLLSDPRRRARQGRSARARSAAFGLRSVMQRHVETWTDLVGTPARTAAATPSGPAAPVRGGH